MPKHPLRQQILHHRLALPEKERRQCSKMLLQSMQESNLMQRFSSIAGYVAIRGEIDISPIMALFSAQGHSCSLPCIEADGSMVFRRWQPDAPLQTGRYGIPCPAEGERIIPQLIMMPLLACDLHGNRLGAGGGYYDRSLCRPQYRHSYRLGVGFHFQLLPDLPSEPHDVTVHGFISEQGFQEFKQPV